MSAKQKWRKIGKIFQPCDKTAWLGTHAMLPFAEQVEGSVFKIYFTARDRQERGHTYHLIVDLLNPTEILEIATNSILTPGALGFFDDNGVTSTCLVSDNGRKYLYYTGWNRDASVPFRTAIGVAVSDDGGRTFVKCSSGPIMDRCHIDPCFAISGWVLKEDDQFRMWYVSGLEWKLFNGQPRHYNHIKYAESLDGINWKREGKIAIDFSNAQEHTIGAPRVFKSGERYRMWYHYRGESYRIGYAQSVDGINWQRMDDLVQLDVSSEGWDSDMVGSPFFIEHNGDSYMLYNGNGYGKTGFGLAVME